MYTRQETKKDALHLEQSQFTQDVNAVLTVLVYYLIFVRRSVKDQNTVSMYLCIPEAVLPTNKLFSLTRKSLFYCTSPHQLQARPRLLRDNDRVTGHVHCCGYVELWPRKRNTHGHVTRLVYPVTLNTVETILNTIF